MFVNHQLLNTNSNLPPPIDENLEPEDAFGLDKLQHYRFFVYGQFKFLSDGSEFKATPDAINTVALGFPTMLNQLLSPCENGSFTRRSKGSKKPSSRFSFEGARRVPSGGSPSGRLQKNPVSGSNRPSSKQSIDPP